MYRGSKFSIWANLFLFASLMCGTIAWAQDQDITANTSWPEGVYTYGNITVRTGATLTLNGVTQITATNITVETGAAISANGTGYAANEGPGAANGDRAGGSHAGIGGNSASAPYGSAVAPVEKGSGGTGSAGGGAIRMIISGTLTVEGTISANGAQPPADRGAGAGGSIFINAGTFAGAGSIQANGAAATPGVPINAGGGGGGGRVAVHYTASNFTGIASATGGWGNNAPSGAAGTVGLFDESNPAQVILRAGHNWRFEEEDTGVTYWDITLQDTGTTLETGVTALSVDNSLFVGGTSLLTLNGATQVNAANITVETNAAISADGKGYAAGLGPAAGTTGYVGGSHGGIGGNNEALPYGSAVAPVEMGSGGSGAAGGGAIRMIVSGTLTVDGRISANGAAPSSKTGAGAGGSVYITTGTLAGTGSLQAKGMDGTPGAYIDNSAGGGGGRVAVHYTTSTFTGTALATGGVGRNVQGGAAGTVGLFDESNPAQVVLRAGHNWRFEEEDAGINYWDILLSNTVTALEANITSVSAANSIVVGGTSTFTLNSITSLTALTITVEASAAISADGKGYAAGLGPAAGTTGYVGGGYGGIGGNNSAVPYGSAVAPVDMGSGGSGAAGGGAIRMIVSGTLTVDGRISANGAAPSSKTGAGAGGSLYITTGTLAGTGSLQAKGMDGTPGVQIDNSAGGGGGRVAVHYTTNTFTGTSLATGGAGRNAQAGNPGTVGLFDESNPEKVILHAGHNWRFEQDDVDASLWDVQLQDTALTFETDVAEWTLENSLSLAGTSSMTLNEGLKLNVPNITLAGTASLTGQNVELVLGGSLLIRDTSVLTVGGASKVTAATVTVETSAVISADGRGYAKGEGPGAGTTNAAGGSHGGAGGLANLGTYDSAVAPVEMGSGGTNGVGGGAIQLTISGTLTVDGRLSADAPGAPCNDGAGAGGSIYVVTGTLAGSGSIQANGGRACCYGCSSSKGGGGGGRVAVHYDASTFSGTASANGGPGYGADGAPGTVGFFDESNPEQVILIPGHNWRFEAVDSAVSYWDIRIQNAYASMATGVTELILGNSLLVGSASTLVFIGASHITAAYITVEADSVISADGRGYAKGEGPGAGTTNAAGGSHGGAGGLANLGTYDSAVAPVEMGSGGTNGVGGGAIQLTISGTLTVDGRLSADAPGAPCNDGAGAGGSIYVVTGTLAGSGSIQANGGRACCYGCSSAKGGGGGGRVALHYSTNSFSGTASANGGPGAGADGAPGTVKWFHHIPIVADQIVEGDVEQGVERVYVLDWPGGDGMGLVRLTPAESLESWSLLGRYDIPPMAGDTQWTGVGPTMSEPASHELLVPVSTAGRYFFNPHFTGATGAPHFGLSFVDVGAYYAAPISLGSAGNAGLFASHIYASGVTSHVRVFLRTEAKTDVCEGAISNITATGFDVSFNLTGIDAGALDVVILWPDGTETVIENGLTITDETNTIWYVDHENTGTEDGLSWATAFKTIQPAIDAASTAGGGEVWVAEGNYNETRTHVDGSLEMKEGVYLYGGFVGIAVSGGMETDRSQRDWNTHVTTIDGSVARGGAAAYHVVVGANNAILDGFTITGGNASGGDTATGRGGGLYNPAVSPTVVNCTFTGNTASHAGGGLQNSGSSAVVENCTFANNTGRFGGGVENEGGQLPTFRACTFTLNTGTQVSGGMHIASTKVVLTDCVFTANTAPSGGGMYCYADVASSPDETEVTFTNCVFQENTAPSGEGGGIHIGNRNGSVTANLTNCSFLANTAVSGGGIYSVGATTYGTDTWLTLKGCTFLGNTASSGSGGGIFSHTLCQTGAENCIFANNQATANGGGIAEDGTTGTFINCTFFHNTATGLGGGLYALGSPTAITNCILWNDAPQEISGGAAVNYSDVEYGYIGTGNLDAAPQFVNAAAGDFHLVDTSPCINAGTNDGAPTTDTEGNPRPVDGKTDMGAYENQGAGDDVGGFYCCPTEGTEDGFCVGPGANHLCAHAADYTPLDRQISVRELIRVAQFHNFDGFHCAEGTEDGFAPGAGDTTCTAHSSDYNPQNWQISVSELLRLKQFHDAGTDPTIPGGVGNGNCSITHTGSSIYYTPGNTFRMEVELRNNSAETVTGIAFVETLPDGWTFQGIQSGAAPDVLPAIGAAGTIAFAKLFSPTVPWKFSYDVLVPVTETEPQRKFSGQFFFRTSGLELRTPVGEMSLLIEPEPEGEGQTEGTECGTWDDCATACLGAPNTDNDRDGLTACVEACLCTSDSTADTDDDGMPDPFELQNNLDPTTDDAADDTDQDGIPNLDEYVQGSAPNDPGSPYTSGIFYVGPGGVDAAGHGTFALPWATISYSLNQVNPGPAGGARIILLEGAYEETVALKSGVALSGITDAEARIIGRVTGAAGSTLEHLILQAGQGVEYLLDMDNVAMTVREVVFVGVGTETGILVDGTNPLNSVIEQCIFTDLSVGIDIGQDIPAIRRNMFQDISTSAIIVRATQEPVSGGSLGDVSDAAVGCNTFALSIAGPAVVNERADTLKMEQNDWGTDDANAIAARIEGAADFEPFLAMGSGILAGSVYCTVWDAATQTAVNDASVSLGTYGPVTESIRGVYAFPAVPQGFYTTTTEAPGYQTDTQNVNLLSGQSKSVLAALVPEEEGEGGAVEGQAEGENEGEGEGEPPNDCNCSNPQKTLPTKSEMFLGALTVLTLLVSRRFYRLDE